jgi:Asp-tRNA(Asn)/Glu-tRNA(Gln) amidotransferase A subunit family amidase
MGTTGNAINCLIWTLAGLPCLTLPLFLGENDMPFGLQLIGGKQEDDRLFRTSAWLQHYLQNDINEEEKTHV